MFSVIYYTVTPNQFEKERAYEAKGIREILSASIDSQRKKKGSGEKRTIPLSDYEARSGSMEGNKDMEGGGRREAVEYWVVCYLVSFHSHVLLPITFLSTYAAFVLLIS